MKLNFQSRRQRRFLHAAFIAVVMLAFVAGIFGLSLEAADHDLAGAYVTTFVVCALLAPRATSGVAYTATLILPLILKKFFDAYRAKLPFLKYFAFDITPDKVKFGQDIIAQMPVIPTATSHVPGDDITAVGSQNVKDLLVDIPMKIDQAAKVVLKVPTGDAVSLELNPVFNAAIENAAYALGAYIAKKAVGQGMSPGNFSHEIVEDPADVDKETLSAARVQLNKQKAGVPRFGLTSSAFMSSLTNDPRIASGDYYGKLVDENPYVTLQNIEGFSSISELIDFPVDGATDVFTADAANDVITQKGHGFADGSSVRLSNAGGALPAGLAAATTYYVVSSTPDTYKLSAALGGAAINITDGGTGVHTALRYDHAEAFLFAMPALLIAIRQLADNIDLAKALGIPVPILTKTMTEPETGLTASAFMWIDTKTQDIWVALIVAFGIRGGKQATGNAADTLTDRSGLRVVTQATS